jgi:hypothetical protein
MGEESGTRAIISSSVQPLKATVESRVMGCGDARAEGDLVKEPSEVLGTTESLEQ